jgi:cytochrome c-type biogenesis protein CcmH/NrfG
MATKPLKRWSTDELETAIYSGSLDNIQRYEAERIISERERAPERRLARRSYNAAAWALAFSMGTFIVALVILWLLATGKSLP